MTPSRSQRVLVVGCFALVCLLYVLAYRLTTVETNVTIREQQGVTSGVYVFTVLAYSTQAAAMLVAALTSCGVWGTAPTSMTGRLGTALKAGCMLCLYTVPLFAFSVVLGGGTSTDVLRVLVTVAVVVFAVGTSGVCLRSVLKRRLPAVVATLAFFVVLGYGTVIAYGSMRTLPRMIDYDFSAEIPSLLILKTNFPLLVNPFFTTMTAMSPTATRWWLWSMCCLATMGLAAIAFAHRVEHRRTQD